jgi:hypothetical protein
MLRNRGLRDLIAMLDAFRDRGIRTMIGTAALVAAALVAGGLWPLQAGATLVLSPDGTTVYDTVNNINWLADADLAATNRFGLPLCTGPGTQTCVNASGSMRYQAAEAWVNAMNAANYLGHTDWLLPTTPSIDPSCPKTGQHGNSFGFNCTASALASVYYNALGLKAPSTAVPIPNNTVGPFSNFQPYLYWSQTSGGNSPGGHATFSFNTGFQGSNTPAEFLYVLPMIQGKIPGTPPATGQGLQLNPDGQTVYDPVTNVTWVANANLGATNTFGLPPCKDPTTPAICVNPDGAMTWDAASQFVTNMNTYNGAGYLGQTHWQLPSIDPNCPNYNCDGNSNPMGELFYDQLGLSQGMPVVATPDIAVGPFRHIQPYLYWACEAATIQDLCQTTGPAPGFEFSFTFGNGFVDTDILANDLYVTAYFVGPPSISLSNVQLGFYYVAGGALPAAQTIGVASSNGGTLSWSASANVPWITLTPTSSDFTVAVNPAGLGLGPHSGTISVTAPGGANTPQTVSVTLTVASAFQPPPPSATRFVPITPCRIADTRNANGPFGGPTLPRQTERDFVIPSSACSIPPTAVAYSMNVAVVPSGPLGFLTLWPTGQPQPLVATLNSIDGRVKSNAAIVPAGANGAISAFVTDATDVVLDINGYFVPTTNTSALAFYPVTPCRVADTRNPTAPLGGPSLAAQSTRSFPILASSCGLPASAQAYSLNFAAVPKGPTLGFMTAWPAGQPQPLVASLNDPTGTVLSNAVVVPAGTNGRVSVFTTDATDLVIDINGYFAPPGPGGLSLYTVSPCRVLDSRLPAGSPPFNITRDVNVTASPCGVPAAAQAFVFNATVVPPGFLGYITMWPQGQTQPLAATLNAYDGAVTNNMAIVPTTTGSVSVFPSAATHLVLDIFGYFAP